TLRDAPESFANFVCGEGGRTPAQILAHMGDLYDWAFSLVSGNQVWKDSLPLPWEKEVDRFFATLKKFDNYLASGEPLHDGPGALFEGQTGDPLTQMGQLAMRRRMAESKIKGENYQKAKIALGGVGLEQPPPRREF